MSRSLSDNLVSVINSLSTLSSHIGSNIKTLSNEISEILAILKELTKKSNSSVKVINSLEKVLKNIYMSYDDIGTDVGKLGQSFKSMEELVELPNSKNCVLLR